MSLLEDVFLEDEAGEAQELERVIEGDELDVRPGTPDSNDDSEKEDEAEEDKRVVDHTAKAKRVVKNPRFVLNPARLMGPRGIQVIPEHFKDFKFKGKGNEKEDLDLILKKLEHWAYRLYPKFKFDDCLKKIETLGRKRPVMVHLHKIRTDQYLSEETVQQQESSGDEAAPPQQEEDEFDRLLQQQIELARATPAPNSAKKELHTPMSNHRSPLVLPKVSSSPSISDEQKERMMMNRKLAEERRLARLNQANNSTQSANTSTEAVTERIELNSSATNDLESTEEIKQNVADMDARVINDIDKDIPVVRKHNRTNVIDSDSSDDENDVMTVNESIAIDVHNSIVKDDSRPNEAIPESGDENTDGTPKDDIDMERVADDPTGITDEVIEDVPIVKKHHRTNVIDSDSSDDENDVMVVNESITIDVHNNVKDISRSYEAIPKSGDENADGAPKDDISMERVPDYPTGIINEVIEDVPKVNKHHRTNVIDSVSSDDGNVLGLNESVTIDVQNPLPDVVTGKHNSDKDKTSKELDRKLVKNVTTVSSDNYKLSENKESDNSISEMDLPNDETSKDTHSEITSDSNVNKTEIPSESKNQKKDSDTLTEDLMDVDFSEEF